MKKIILIVTFVTLANSDNSCNIPYYKMMSNRDDIKSLQNEVNTNNFKKCMSKSDCKISIKSLKDLDIELTKKYHNCKKGGK